MNEAQHRLANVAGIELGYWDGLGIRRDLCDTTFKALLEALDIGHAASAEAHCELLADRSFLTPLRPSVVLRAGTTAELLLSMPQVRRHEKISWDLELETGERQSGEVAPERLTLVEERAIDGLNYGRFRLPLPSGIPLGYHRFSLPAYSSSTFLIVAPERCFIPQPIQAGKRCWGLGIQLYALRSSRNWGIGDFGDLAVLATAAGRAGADFIGLNPMHARHLDRPDEASPYGPSSRVFLDPLYIDVEAVADFAACSEAQAAVADPGFQARLGEARNHRLVDYAAVTSLKLAVLQILFDCFKRQTSDAGRLRMQDFRDFKQHRGAALARFAEFEALRMDRPELAGNVCAWRDWPEEFRDPSAPGLARLRVEAAGKIEYHMYLQWVAAGQLQSAGNAARAAGMSIGLYRDLAVGAAHDSAETWSDQALFSHDMSVGAPPDMLNGQGQSWGLAPWNPRELVRQGYAPFRRLLASNMQNAGALRIDHVMALMRLFWIPRGMNGADGGYVRHPFDDLAAIVALESMRNRCMVIGEDLGSVPEGFRARLGEWGFLSYRVLIYERHWGGDGRFCLPDEYPQQSLATVATHDMPTMTEYWLGDDIRRRAQIGMYPDAEQRDAEAARREREREGLQRLLRDTGLSPSDPSDAGAVVNSLHAAVARSRSMLAVVQLDDLLGETEPVNIPGTYREYPNWRRKLSLPIEEVLADARWIQLATLMREAGRG